MQGFIPIWTVRLVTFVSSAVGPARFALASALREASSPAMCAASSEVTRKEAAGSSAGAAAKVGIGFGSALAITISWSMNKSILWAIVHGILSWFYVVYYAIRYHD